MKKLLFFFMLFAVLNSSAQIKEITLQASGLTCSMCSKSIYKSLVAVSFVQDVQSDIKNSAFIITLKTNMEADFDVLKNAVVNAGFSVASFKIIANFSEQTVKNDAHILFDHKTLHFLNVKPQTLNGTKTIQLVDKNFVTNKEAKKYTKLTTMKCYETGFMESCCSKKSTASSNRVYHVTVL